MALRIMRCRCNHRLRYGRAICGYCYRPTPFLNRWWVPVAVLLAVGLWIWAV